MTDLRIQKISSFDSPELQPYATMRRPLEHEAQGIFVAEGEKVVRRLLESRFEVVSVLLPEKHLDSFRPLRSTIFCRTNRDRCCWSPWTR